jgi:hypothetical protein
VFNSQKKFSFADKAYKSIQITIMGSGFHMTYSTIMKPWMIQRSHYGSVDQYVIAFQDSISDANRVSSIPTFTPYFASGILLKSLESELHAWVKIRQEKYLMQDSAVEHLTTDDFMTICNKAIDESRASVDSQSMYASRAKSDKSLKTDKTAKSSAPSTAQSSKTNVKKSRRSGDARIKKFPPKDMDWQEYARQ